HVRRLRNSARLMALDVPFSDEDLAREVRRTQDAARLGAAEAYIRVLVTRGVGALTYDPAATPSPTLGVIVKPLDEPAAAIYEHGVRVALVNVVRNHPGSVSPLIKSNNLMNSALAMQEA